MDQSELVALLREATFHPHQLGFYLKGTGGIAPVPENCVSLAAGPVVFVVESRTIDDQAVITDGQLFDDHGPSLHVFGAMDQAEHLRFDCFANEPHYHYYRHTEGAQIVCRIDQHAQGDPVQWAIDRVRDRLPEMLEHCCQGELAADVRVNRDVIVGVIDEVEPLLLAARDRAQAAYAAHA